MQNMNIPFSEPLLEEMETPKLRLWSKAKQDVLVHCVRITGRPARAGSIGAQLTSSFTSLG